MRLAKRASKASKAVKKTAAKPAPKPKIIKARKTSTTKKVSPKELTARKGAKEALIVEPQPPVEPLAVQPAAEPALAQPEPSPATPLMEEEPTATGEEAPVAPPVNSEAALTAPEVIRQGTPPLLPVAHEAEALPAAPVLAPLPAEEAGAMETQEEVEELPPRKDVPPNHIFIGKKPIMGYALSGVMQLTQYPEVVLRARGKAISRAVDVAEVIINRLGNGQFVARSIEIDTDVVGEGAERRNVSTIRISVGKKE